MTEAITLRIPVSRREPMVTVTQIPPDGLAASRQSRSRGFVVVGVLVLALVVSASYAAGGNHGNRLKELDGNAYVGAHQASVRVDGWAYGIADSVPWFDSAGSFHESGWPICLGGTGSTVRIRFGEIPVTGPNAVAWRAVAWVDCRGAVVIH
jgi:hypothetical protein